MTIMTDSKTKGAPAFPLFGLVRPLSPQLRRSIGTAGDNEEVSMASGMFRRLSLQEPLFDGGHIFSYPPATGHTF